MAIRDLLERRRRGGRAVLAANFYNAETLLAVLAAARAAGEPIILQTSPSTLKYLGVRLAAAMARTAAAEVGVDAYLHLDHCADLAQVRACLGAGYDSIMVDGSELPYAENVALVRQAVALAAATGAAVEAELGYVPKLGQEVGDAATYTDPDQAARFVAETGIDWLAPAFGTAHGLAKVARLDFARLATIAERVQRPLVMHGGSGLSAALWSEAVRCGVAKSNFASEIKDVFVARVRSSLSASDDIDLRRTFPPAIHAVRDLVAGKLAICGAASAKGAQA
jgi:tagatose 1,6-diphosphate aldolase GatY/KbaY